MRKSDVIAHFETQAKVGEILGITQAAVSKWPDLVPEKQALKLSLITKGALPYNPDVYLAVEPPANSEPVSQEAAA